MFQAAPASSPLLSLTDIAVSLEPQRAETKTVQTRESNTTSIDEIARKVFCNVSLYDSLPSPLQRNLTIRTVLLTKAPERFQQLSEDAKNLPHLQLCAFVAAYFLQKQDLFEEMRTLYPICQKHEEALTRALSPVARLPDRINALWDIFPFVLYHPDTLSPLVLQARVSDTLRNNPLLAEEAIKKVGGTILSFFSPHLRDNEYLASMAYRSAPEIFPELSERLQSSPAFRQSLGLS